VTSLRPYVDRPVVDVAAATAVAQRAAASWELPDPSLIRHGMNVLFACGDVVVRVGHASGPAAAAHELVGMLLRHDVPTVTPVVGLAVDLDGFAVTAWERVEPVDAPVDWESVGAAVRSVHGIPPTSIPPSYPLPAPTGFPWWDFDALLAEVAPDLDEPAASGLEVAIRRHDGWRDAVVADAVVCHGDVHPGNVLVTGAGALLIDWDLLCRAAPAWDHAMLTTFASRWGGDRAAHAAFVAGYGRADVDLELAAALGELRNVAATLLRVRAGRTDPAAAAEAGRRLRYWRGESDEPWRAQ
jgi:hypothetical protein